MLPLRNQTRLRAFAKTCVRGIFFLAPLLVSLLLVSPLLATLWLAATALVHADERAPQWRMTPLAVDGPVPYFIAPGLEELGYRPQDEQLAEWALAAWSNASEGVLCFYPAEGSKALLRIYWSPVAAGRYGQMQPIPVDKQRGGEVYVRPHLLDLEQRAPEVGDLALADPVFRDAVVYLMLLHEIGHALGLVHTLEVSDVMYFGGDVLAYFRNYRGQLGTRADIPRNSGLSPNDVARVRRLYPPTLWLKPKPVAEEETKTSNQAPASESALNTTSGGGRK